MASQYERVSGRVLAVNARSGEVRLRVPDDREVSLHASGFIGGSTDFPHPGDRVLLSLLHDEPVSARICHSAEED